MRGAPIGRVVAVLLAAWPCTAHAQAVTQRPSIETAASASSVSDGYGNWTSGYARGTWQTDARTTLFPEIAVSRQFHDDGTLFALGATHTFDDDWYGFASASTSAGGFYLPRFRGVAVLDRKLLPSRRLVVNVGGSFAQWKDAHSDVGLSAGAIYYFAAPVVVEAGTNRNISRPGNVASQSYFAAITAGRAGSRVVVARISGGREAYAALAPGLAITDFASRTQSLVLRQWLTPSAGIVAGAEHYSNQFYHRTGMTLGAFWSIE
jgi:YaiO family outer membrane protein